MIPAVFGMAIAAAVGFHLGWRRGCAEMRAQLNVALNLRPKSVAIDLSREPETAELLAMLRSKQQHPAGSARR